ncbi:nitroreductase [Desulfitobacterium dichloroeliminans LMG P-21439]|uniref:Nitroreductase n=1 Tax=Desulfitobacterium dichloroeliminans (strain LMG P-21439 / DCA1) TaxID=871963 RepID=L0F502_DESDL|nr:nitroreductase family protein [Desulfitobacterium dichloroeliminans]AGA68272.1 nitroreductase [Desulfitobacterium dichloroeliminans LMG P-21439]
MQIPNEKWYTAVFQRRSRRKFNAKPLAPEVLTQLMDFTHVLNKEYSGARVQIVNQSPDEVFKGAIGSYGKIKGSPAYVAFIGNVEDSHVQEKVGYIGECFILEATSMGLATCWVGGFFKQEVVKQQIEISQNERVIAVSPLGYASEQYSLEEKIMSGFASGHKRKDIEDLCIQGFKADWPAWVKSALELSRLAPSAVNRQPWRFSVDTNSIKITVDDLKDSYHISKRLDCGIAMIHIEIGASHEGVRGQWEYLDQSEIAVFKANR